MSVTRQVTAGNAESRSGTKDRKSSQKHETETTPLEFLLSDSKEDETA